MKEVNDLTFKMLVMMTTRQFKAQRHMIIPYMLALSAMFGMEFILLSLDLMTMFDVIIQSYLILFI